MGQLYWDSRLDVSDVMITVSQGKVTLKGSVPTYNAMKAKNGLFVCIRSHFCAELA